MTVLTPGGVAVVTGGASGIGWGITQALHAQGLRVEVVDLDPRRLEEAAAQLPIGVHALDVTDADALRALAARLTERHGGIDVLVNNAGVGPAASIIDTTLKDWRWILDVNLMGVIHGIDAFLPGMLERGTPAHIVNTASMSALDPIAGLGAYAASKAAVAALTDALVAELEGTPVGVSLLVPANVRTNIAETSAALRPATDSGFGDYRPAAPPAEIRWRTPEQVGELVIEGIRTDRQILITHPEQWPRVAERQRRLRTAFGSDAIEA